MTQSSQGRRERRAAAKANQQQTRDRRADADSYIFRIYSDTYVRAVWFVELDTCDVMGAMIKTPGEDWWVGYRFRHYADKKVWGSEDRKTVYRITRPDKSMQVPTPQELDELDAAMTVALSLMAAECEKVSGKPAGFTRLDVNATGIAAAHIIMAQPWAHTKHGPALSLSHERGKA